MDSSPKFFLVDGHSDFANRVRDERRAGRPGALCSEYVPALRAGRVRGVVVQVGSDSADENEYEAMAGALEKISYMKSEAATCPEVALLKTRRDLTECIRGNTIGLVFALEGGKAFHNSSAYVSIYHALGVRMAALTWNDCNLLACGSGTNRLQRGLTDLGVQVVREMSRLNMILDVSHLSDRGVSDALSIASGPVVASHSNARSICGHDRNLSDAHIRGIAETGGVIGINFFPRFLRQDGRPDASDILAHIAHIIAVGGENAVALGPDFIDYSFDTAVEELRRSSVDYGSDFRYPVGLESARDLRSLPDILARAGFSNVQIGKILGENWLRVLRAALS